MSQLKVINAHVGYRPGHGKKRIYCPDVPEAQNLFRSRLFMVYEQNRFSKEPLNSPNQPEYVHRGEMRRHRGDFGDWLVGDFSGIETPGVYQAFIGHEPGVTFAVRRDVWRRVLPECIRYFQVQSCGRDVPGWHPACHLDDGYIPEEDRYIEAPGGWHDAGDFRKWVTSTALNAIALLIAHRIWSGREEQLGLAPDVFLDEAMQGVRFFLGMQDPQTGMVYHNIGGGRESRHDNLDNRYTDNVPASGDERRVCAHQAATPPKCTTLFALYAGALADRDEELSARCLQAALKSAEYDLAHDTGTADLLQWRAWGFLEIWRRTADPQHRTAAVDAMARLLDLQVIAFIGGQSETRGFFRAGGEKGGFHHKHIGADYPIWVLGEFLDAWPEEPDAGRWRDAVAMWVDDYVRVFVDRNPFGLLPYSFYDAPHPEHTHCLYRRLGDGLYFRYWTADNPFGNNARNALSAAAVAAAARVLDRPELLDDAYRLIEWTVGANPFRMSTMNGVGVLQPCALSFQMGNIPGGVTMGVSGDDDDRPVYNNPWLCWDEYYGYQTSQFTWALLALEDLER